MPITKSSTYKSPRRLFNRHLQTIIPAGLRKVENAPILVRERIETEDDDFLDLDWARNDGKKLVIISHGLEGNSQRPYNQGMIKVFHQAGWNVLAWNYRGCSGEINKAPRLYHSGATDDLEWVINHAVKKQFKSILLVGFSLGGNITLKYLGEKTTKNFEQVIGAVVFSVPLDLEDCSHQINKPENFIYSYRFLRSLRAKVLAKARQYPEKIDLKPLKGLKSIFDFDDVYTAPFHGFEGALDYYQRCSSIGFVDGISVPTLIINAANDPFLSGACFDPEPFETLELVTFEKPEQGGHCGFASYDNGGVFWSEKKALEFADSII